MASLNAAEDYYLLPVDCVNMNRGETSYSSREDLEQSLADFEEIKATMQSAEPVGLRSIEQESVLVFDDLDESYEEDDDEGDILSSSMHVVRHDFTAMSDSVSALLNAPGEGQKVVYSTLGAVCSSRFDLPSEHFFAKPEDYFCADATIPNHWSANTLPDNCSDAANHCSHTSTAVMTSGSTTSGVYVDVDAMTSDGCSTTAVCVDGSEPRTTELESSWYGVESWHQSAVNISPADCGVQPSLTGERTGLRSSGRAAEHPKKSFVHSWNAMSALASSGDTGNSLTTSCRSDGTSYILPSSNHSDLSYILPSNHQSGDMLTTSYQIGDMLTTSYQSGPTYDQISDMQATYNRSNDMKASYNQSNDMLATSHQSNDMLATTRQTNDMLATSHQSNDMLATSHQSNDMKATSHQSNDMLATYNQSNDMLAASRQTNVMLASSHQSNDMLASSHQGTDSHGSDMVDTAEEDEGSKNLCDICGHSFIHPSSLRLHMRRKHGQASGLQHGYIGYSSEQKPVVELGSGSVSGDVCDQCGQLMSDCACATSEAVYKWSKSSYSSPVSSQCNKVAAAGSTDDLSRCTHCARIFSSTYSLNTHIKSVHFTPRPFLCGDCGKSYTTSASLHSHMMMVHGHQRCMCEICGKYYASKYYLKLHKKIHTETKDYSCNFCSKAFIDQQALRLHLRVHTGERPYRCLACGRGFAQSSHLKTHSRLHTGEKPFKCNVCGKMFRQQSNVMEHERIHRK